MVSPHGLQCTIRHPMFHRDHHPILVHGDLIRVGTMVGLGIAVGFLVGIVLEWPRLGFGEMSHWVTGNVQLSTQAYRPSLGLVPMLIKLLTAHSMPAADLTTSRWDVTFLLDIAKF